jgi:hypothetical protein
MCRREIDAARRGRPRLYCSNGCKQRAYRIYQSGILCRVSLPTEEISRLRLGRSVRSTADPFTLVNGRLSYLMEAVADAYLKQAIVPQNAVFRAVQYSECWTCQRWFETPRSNTRRYCSDACRSRAFRARQRRRDFGLWARIPLPAYSVLASLARKRGLTLGRFVANSWRTLGASVPSR